MYFLAILLLLFSFSLEAKNLKDFPLEYYRYNDTLWTLHNYIDGLNGYDKYILRFGGYEIEGKDEILKTPKSEIWSATKPHLITHKIVHRIGFDRIFAQFDTSIVVMQMRIDDIVYDVFSPKNINPMDVDKYQNTLIQDTLSKFFYLVENHACNLDLRNRPEYKLYADSLLFKTADIGFWRFHIAPEVWWFRRDIFGKENSFMNDPTAFWSNSAIKDTINNSRVQYREAMKQREEMVKRMSEGGISNTDELLKVQSWLNPILSEVSSTIISVSFKGDTQIGDRIILDSQDPELDGGNDLFFTHIPPRMYRVSGNLSPNDIKRAAIKLHTRSNAEEEEAGKLLNCGGWEETDIRTSTYIFPPSNSTPRYQNRNFNIDDAIFMYDGCPCDTIPGIGKTPVELQQYIYKPIPTHWITMVEDALLVFQRLRGELTEATDRIILDRKILQAKHILERLQKTYNEIYGNNIPPCTNCPRTWLDEPVIQRILRRRN